LSLPSLSIPPRLVQIGKAGAGVSGRMCLADKAQFFFAPNASLAGAGGRGLRQHAHVKLCPSRSPDSTCACGAVAGGSPDQAQPASKASARYSRLAKLAEQAIRHGCHLIRSSAVIARARRPLARGGTGTKGQDPPPRRGGVRVKLLPDADSGFGPTCAASCANCCDTRAASCFTAAAVRVKLLA